jgi:hypothetical protein
MNDLSELFARNPQGLSDQDITRIVTRMREAQAQHELGVKAPVAPRVKKQSPKTVDLLKDLGLS